MNILIIGCKKVGSRLANMLSRDGHTVSVVDVDERTFENLDNDFDGYTICGVPIDQDVLKRAGIESCDAIAAVTPDDNVNIMVCQIAGELFNVPLVLARIYDPAREETFQRFGISTVCSTNLTVNAVRSALLSNDKLNNQTIGTATIDYITLDVPKGYVGRTAESITGNEQEVLFAILHENGTITLAANSSYNLTATDKLVFAKVID